MTKPLDLEKHVHATYFSLRVGMALIAFAFPFILWLGGRFWAGIEHPASMSAYYHMGSDGKSMRDWFVGVLFVIGACLYLYKGYSRRENFALNLAGLMAVGIAVIPMAWDCGHHCPKTSLHGTLSVLFFVCIGFVCIWCAGESLSMLPDAKLRARFRLQYRICAALMVAAPLISFGLKFIYPDKPAMPLFCVEATGVIAFAVYWGLKSWELHLSQADKKALRGQWKA